MTRRWTTWLLLVALPAAVHAADFEGSVVYRRSSPNISIPLGATRYSLKPGFVRFEDADDTDPRLPVLITDEARVESIALGRVNQTYLRLPIDYRDPRSPAER